MSEIDPVPLEQAVPDDRDRWLSRLKATAQNLSTDDLRLAVRQIEAVAAHRSAEP